MARRRPHVLAHQVATLDNLSGGRVTFGAGLGGVPSEFGKFGEPTDAKVRAAMLDEGLELLRGLWSGEEVTHRGEHYTVEGVTLAPEAGASSGCRSGSAGIGLRRCGVLRAGTVGSPTAPTRRG